MKNALQNLKIIKKLTPPFKQLTAVIFLSAVDIYIQHYPKVA